MSLPVAYKMLLLPLLLFFICLRQQIVQQVVSSSWSRQSFETLIPCSQTLVSSVIYLARISDLWCQSSTNTFPIPQINPGVLTIHIENRKIRSVDNQIVRTIPFGKLQKIWAVIWGDAIFLIILVCLIWICIAAGLVKIYNFKDGPLKTLWRGWRNFRAAWAFPLYEFV